MRYANWFMVITLSLAALSCSKVQKVLAPRKAPPPPTYRGPSFLRGAIGSLATLRGYQSNLVSGYGLVVGLKDTGSPDCPPALREFMLTEIAKGGFGRPGGGAEGLTPTQVLASKTTAVVLVQGIIPPGATKGTRFDLIVKALPQTQTTSLVGGTLYTTNLRIGGERFGQPNLNPIASANGPVFHNPFISADAKGNKKTSIDLRVGRVLAGGVATHDMRLELVLNRPSHKRAFDIATRINTRFPQSVNEKFPLAVAKNETLVEINIPQKYEDNVRTLLDVLSHIFMDPTTGFMTQKATELADMLKNPKTEQQKKFRSDYANDTAYVWEAMGTSIVPIIRKYYLDEDNLLRVAALQAGARLGDTQTVKPLTLLAGANLGGMSEQATALLGELIAATGNRAAAESLVRLLDSDDTFVRIAAFHGLLKVNHPAVRQNVFSNKVAVARVACRKPMIYVADSGRPRIVIFDRSMKLKVLDSFSMWKNRFMLKNVEGNEQQIAVYYQHEDRIRGQSHTIPNTVPFLAGTLAFRPHPDSKTVGFDVTYNDMVRILHTLTEKKIINAPLVLQQTNLAQIIERRRLQETPEQRPNTDQAPVGTRPNENEEPKG